MNSQLSDYEIFLNKEMTEKKLLESKVKVDSCADEILIDKLGLC